MSVSPAKSEKNEKLSDPAAEPVRKSSKYVMTCGTLSPPPPKSPEMAAAAVAPATAAAKNAQNSFTSFSISSILSRQNTSEKAAAAADPAAKGAAKPAISLHPQPPPEAAAFMSHLGSSTAMHSCTADSSLMLSR